MGHRSRTRRLRAGFALGAAALVFTGAGACRYPATQVRVLLDSDAPPDRALVVRATVHAGAGVEGDAAEAHAWVRGGADPGGVGGTYADAASLALPASFTVVPGAGGARDGTATLVVEAQILPGPAGGAPIAFRRVARFSFTPRTTTVLPIFLATRCGDVATGCTSVPLDQCTVSARCDEQGMTCGDQGVCVPEQVVPEPEHDTGAPPPRDVPAPRDAAPPPADVPTDAPPAMDAPPATDAPPAMDAPPVLDAPAVDAPPCGDSGGTLCGGACVSVATDPRNCGRCGVACAGGPHVTGGACAAGRCMLTCAAGFDDCDGDPVNGCEAECGAGRGCAAGRCAAGWVAMATPTIAGRYDVGFAMAPERHELFVFGGRTSGAAGFPNDGGRYNWDTNTWTLIPAWPLVPRSDLAVAWTGTELFVFGGEAVGTYNDGALYNPTTNTWRVLPTTGAPSRRRGAHAFWTGTEVLVQGGNDVSTVPGDGALYNPTTNTWRAVPARAPVAARTAATWTGTELLIYGGGNDTACGAGSAVTAGARYTPGGAWTALSATGEPAGRWFASSLTFCAPNPWTAPWTGTQMFVWGGFDGAGYVATGGLYRPSDNTWTATSAAPASLAAGAFVPAMVWTGRAIVGWPVVAAAGIADTVVAYDPAARAWSVASPAGAPSLTSEGCAYGWTGQELIVWGGRDGTMSVGLRTGARYAP